MGMILILLLGLLGACEAQTEDASYFTAGYATEEAKINELFLPSIEVVTEGIQSIKLLALNLSSEVNDTMDLIEDELCNTDCNGKTYLSCDCHGAFRHYNSGRDECSDLPCNFFRTARADLWSTMDDMAMATSYVKLFKATLPMADRLLKQVCTCSAVLPKAIHGCLTGSSPIFMSIRNELKNARWGAINRIWQRLVRPFCSEKCGLDATLQLTKLARVVDETQAESGSCMDMNGVIKFIAENSDYLYEDEDKQDFFRDVGNELWCGGSKSCKRELERKFSTCCYGQLLETFNRKTIKDLRNVIVALTNDESLGDTLDAIMPTILRALDPDQSTCSRRDRDCDLEF